MPASAPADSAVSPQSEAPKQSGSKRLLWEFVVLVVGMALAYGVGRFQTASLTRDAEAHSQQLEQKRQRIGAELQAEQRKVQRLQALRHLHMAILALEERNFGIAQNELGTATQLLEQSQPDANEPAGKLAVQVRGQKLIATEDLSAQRQKLLAWAKALDAAL
jgi:hypothetical protein